MTHIKKFQLFCEGYDEIMKNMVDGIDMNKVNQGNAEIEKLKKNIELKKKQLEDILEKSEKMQVDSFSEDNQDLIKKKKEELKVTIEQINAQILSLEEEINKWKEKLSALKQ
jgi:hypothetical protein